MRRITGVLIASALVLSLPVSAEAAFPGANGKIAFGSLRDTHSTPDIYAMNADGSGVARITNNFGFSAAWSPDGTKIAYQGLRNFSAEIFVMKADGTGQSALTNNTTNDDQPAWSPDGAKIAFASRANGDSDISTMDASGTGQSNITTNPAFDGEPAWSPDGTKIAFVSDRDGGNRQIYKMTPDGSGVTRLTDGSASEDNPEWSPDATKIVFASNRDGNREIYTMNADGTGRTRLTSNLQLDQDPAWSPDGTKIAFVSDRDGNTEIYVMNANGSGQTRLTNEADQDLAPDWQPLRYPRPKGATPLYAPLVPAFAPCASPNRVHAPPLAFGSCSPPAQASGSLTIGTPDANGQAEQSVGSVRLVVLPGNSSTPLDEADVRIDTSLTDVRQKSNLFDYTGELTAVLHVRLTDRLSGVTQTVQDFAFNVTIPCAITADTTIGSTCSGNTTADTVMPGAVPEEKRSIWALGKVEVYDGGPDGLAATTADNTLFATQGVFAP